MRLRHFFLFALLTAILTPALGQERKKGDEDDVNVRPSAKFLRKGPEVGKPVTLGVGVKRTVAQLMAQPVLVDFPRPLKGEGGELRPTPKQNPAAYQTSQFPIPDGDIIRGTETPYFAVGASWTGTQLNEVGVTPPDTQGAVGPQDVIVACNGKFVSYTKAGAIGSMNLTDSSFFSPVSGGAGLSDPRVRYDRLSGKWFIVEITTSSINKVLVAVSDTSTITPSTVWTYFSFNQNVGGFQSGFFDYPSLGIDNNALYIGGNNFSGATGTSTYVVRKSSVTSGGPIVVTHFGQRTDSYGPAGVDNDDPAATIGWIVGADYNSYGIMTFNKITDPAGTPAISDAVKITIPSTTNPVSVPNKNGNRNLAAIDDRTGSGGQIRLNRLTGERTLWVAHALAVNTSGVASTATGRRTASRWYQFSSLASGTPTLAQSGTIFSSAATNPDHYWFPGVSQNGAGVVLAGTCIAGVDRFASIYAAGRIPADTLGTMSYGAVAAASSTSYGITWDGNPHRWGDYSQVAVDAADDQTFWIFQTMCSSTDQWGVRAIQVFGPPPATVTSISPTTIDQGSTVNITVTGTTSAGSGFFDPGAGFVKRLAASFSGTGLTVNSVTFNSVTQCTVNVTASGGAATGARNITVTNPDGQTSTLNNALTVNTSGITLASIAPTSAPAQSPDTVVILTGSNFDNTTVGQWNGSDRSTTYVSATRIDMTVPAADLAYTTTGQIRARKGATTTSPISFGVTSANFSAFPTSFTLVGGIGKGSLSNLLLSDDQYVQVTNNSGGISRGFELGAEFTTTLRTMNPTQIGFFVEGGLSAAVTTGAVVIQVYDWSTGKWRQYASLPVFGTTDDLRGVTGAFDPNLVSPTRVCRFRIVVKSDETAMQRQSVRFDQVYVRQTY
jgi:hypothetical protein